MDIGLGPSVLRDRPRAERRPRRVIAPLLVVVLSLVGGACGGGDGSADGPCGPVRREPLDPRALHVLPGADVPDYRTDPPTSGPHLPSPITDPLRDEPLADPIQVGILEEGGVVIQHVGLSGPARAELEDLAEPGVVVAPADELPGGAAVVATAWVTKQVCDAVDAPAMEAFVALHLGAGPGDHG